MEAYNESLDVDSLRVSHESRTEWGMRRSFLEAHKGKFPLDRLVCLSCCFINTEVYGNWYPSAVMSQLKELAKDLPQEYCTFRQRKSEESMIKFVKSMDESCVDRSADLESRSRSDDDRFKSVLTFVKANTAFQSTDVAFVKSELRVQKPMEQERNPNYFPPEKDINFKASLENFHSSMRNYEIKSEYSQKFGKITKHLRAMQSDDKNSISKLHLAADKVKVCIDCTISDSPAAVENGQAMFVCDLRLDTVLTSSGQGLSKKAAKHVAYNKAVDKLSMPYLQVIELDSGEFEMEVADKPFPVLKKKDSKIAFVKSVSEEVESNEELIQSTRKRNYRQCSHGLAEFIIMEAREVQPGTNSMSILRTSADFSKMLLEFEFRDVGSGVRCRVFLEGQFLEEHFAPTKTSAKIGASDKALEKLRSICWTILRKQTVDGDEGNVTREELMGDISKLNQVISGDNIGNKLLQKMGWTGGGVGKEGNKGIAEPVTVNSVINREGLGLMSERGIQIDFMSKVKTVLMDYARSSKQDDLAFSPQFNKEERAIIHNECRKLGLKSGSKGSGDERFLIVSRKRTANQLLNHVILSGGTTNKYDLLPPGCDRQSLANNSL
ncbi:uncharacterized protein LOC135480516 [Liolophura sinensis]|uniref:uncharacterized protein LOC135480516 n=1 Tax=Liolophura sinensis TaxID=3198878 RepID=UPI003158D86C